MLLVDDHDLTVTSTGSPLAPLVDLLGQGRDVGLHLILARPVGGTARSSFEPVFQRVRELGTPGLVLRGDPQEGPVLGGRRAGPQPPGRGYLVRPDGPDTLVQVAWSPPSTTAGDPAFGPAGDQASAAAEGLPAAAGDAACSPGPPRRRARR